MNNTSRLAVIDCGTNTFHLMFAEIGNEGAVILHAEKTTVKIGEGGIEKRTITPEAWARARRCIADYSRKIKDQSIEQVYAFATSAFRNAENGRLLRDEIATETGIDIHIIPGDEEAELICDGVRYALDIGEKPQLIMDIGGGSVEFIIADQEKTYWKESFEIGAQRLLDRFFTADPIPEESVILLQLYLADVLAVLNEAVKKYSPTVLIGASGTFDTLSDMFVLQEGKDQKENNPEIPLTMNGYYALHRLLVQSSREERLAIPGMVAMRVDMIVVASCLIDFILKMTGISKIRVSQYALKEGVLSRLINS